MDGRCAIARGKEDYFVFGHARKIAVISGQPAGLSPESITPVLVFSAERRHGQHLDRAYGFSDAQLRIIARASARPGMTLRLKNQTRRRTRREQLPRAIDDPPLRGADAAAPLQHDTLGADRPGFRRDRADQRYLELEGRG